MLTFQDYTNDYGERLKKDFIRKAIDEHKQSQLYKTAVCADKYDHQMNETIYNYVQKIWTATGSEVQDFTAANNMIASNFFHRLNTQRCTYLLGNGVQFTKNKSMELGEDGTTVTVDETKEMLGQEFDTDLKEIGYYALIHGVSFGFWNLDRLHLFPVTEFVPIWDEDTGALRAGIRFWQLDVDKPMMAVFYEEDGYTKYRSEQGTSLDFVEVQPKKRYKVIVRKSEEDGEEVIGEENYGALPIVPCYGSNLKQSTLVGMQRAIDSFDLIRSGFANDLTDCAQIYWILENATGMSDAELARFRDRLKLTHIATVDRVESNAVPYTQDIPFQARREFLEQIRKGIYEDFGALDVHTVSAGATNDHIDAAYQPMDEEADAFEYQIIQFIQQILALNGIEDTPMFKRNRISNQKEQTDMVLSATTYLDDETVLSKLPFITPDEVIQIMAKKDLESENRFMIEQAREEPTEEEYNDGLDDMDAQFDELERLLNEDEEEE